MQKAHGALERDVGAAHQRHLAAHGAQTRQVRREPAAIRKRLAAERGGIGGIVEADLPPEGFDPPEKRLQRPSWIEMGFVRKEERLGEAPGKIGLKPAEFVGLHRAMRAASGGELPKIARIAIRRHDQRAATLDLGHASPELDARQPRRDDGGVGYGRLAMGGQHPAPPATRPRRRDRPPARAR